VASRATAAGVLDHQAVAAPRAAPRPRRRGPDEDGLLVGRRRGLRAPPRGAVMVTSDQDTGGGVVVPAPAPAPAAAPPSASAPPGAPRPPWWRARLLSSDHARRPPAGVAAVGWKEGRWLVRRRGDLIGGAVGVVVFSGLVVRAFGILLGSAFPGLIGGCAGLIAATMLGSGYAIAVLVAGETRAGSFDLLRMLPAGAGAVLRAKLRGLVAALAPFLLMMAGALVIGACLANPAASLLAVAVVIPGLALAVASWWALCALLALELDELPLAAAPAIAAGAVAALAIVAGSVWWMLPWQQEMRDTIGTVLGGVAGAGLLVALAVMLRRRLRRLAGS
jgi:hypothetical protein